VQLIDQDKFFKNPIYLIQFSFFTKEKQITYVYPPGKASPVVNAVGARVA
jgi:hypothetical protein